MITMVSDRSFNGSPAAPAKPLIVHKIVYAFRGTEIGVLWTTAVTFSCKKCECREESKNDDDGRNLPPSKVLYCFVARW